MSGNVLHQKGTASFAVPFEENHILLSEKFLEFLKPFLKKILSGARGRDSRPSLPFYFFLRNKNERKRITFIARKKRTRIIKVKSGFLGASVARSIMGKPNTIAGSV